MLKKIYLFNRDGTPEKAAFPVIDAHNHLWGNWQSDRIIKTMDEVGVAGFCDVTGNVRIEFAGGGYKIMQGDLSDFFQNCSRLYPGRFYCFTMSSFARPASEPLFDDPAEFVEECITKMHLHHKDGAKGLKILKELGLRFRDAKGVLINTDDVRLAPVWDEAGKLGMPVLMHQADPLGFFEPVTEENEHFGSLMKYPDWSFAGPQFPRKPELLKRRDNVIRNHPGTTFILPHFANFAENISGVSDLLDNNPNVYIDFSARLDELGRQPYSSREFFIKHQDRIIFGSDMPANIETSARMYRTYFRFLETYDEGFYSPDYDGTFDRARWAICGIGLPPEVLEKIYFRNIIRIIPSLKEDLKEFLPST